MPRLDGLALAQSLEHPFTRKVILTGVADEELAISAFNQGLIDYFIKKQWLSASYTLFDLLRQQFEAFFETQSAVLMRTLGARAPGFLSNAEMARRITERMRTHNLVEYYLVAEPSGSCSWMPMGG